MKLQVWAWRCEAVKDGVVCGHTWLASGERPYRCAKCKSARWHVTKEAVEQVVYPMSADWRLKDAPPLSESRPIVMDDIDAKWEPKPVPLQPLAPEHPAPVFELEYGVE